MEWLAPTLSALAQLPLGGVLTIIVVLGAVVVGSTYWLIKIAQNSKTKTIAELQTLNNTLMEQNKVLQERIEALWKRQSELEQANRECEKRWSELHKEVVELKQAQLHNTENKH